jgi:putative endonuclease
VTAAQPRQRAERKGRHAEVIAAMYLRLKGYSILAERHRTPSGEIDLIARRGRMLAFVEVKARREADAAIEAVTYGARRRIVQAAGLFLSRRPDLAECAIRYDIIAVAGWRLRHLRDAWREGE